MINTAFLSANMHNLGERNGNAKLLPD